MKCLWMLPTSARSHNEYVVKKGMLEMLEMFEGHLNDYKYHEICTIFSSIVKKECWVLTPSLKRLCYFKKILFFNMVHWALHKTRSCILYRLDKMQIGIFSLNDLKSYWICCKIFKVCLTILEYYELKFSHSAFTCSSLKLTIEILEQGVKYVQS